MNKILTFLIVLASGTIYCQDNSLIPFLPDGLRKVVLIQPTGETAEGLPEMRIVHDTTELYKTTTSNIKNSFVNDFLDFYFIVQVFLKNNNKSDSIEPAYLALTENQGGFAKFGFSILEKDSHIIKSHTPYIDITVGQATESPNKLMSFTQLYPHEMGHVFFHLLSPEDSTSNNTKNVDMHFFSIITDYSTAFNEGFAEHIENISRTFEKNEDIKRGIFTDIENIENSSKKTIKGFERDFIYPLRLGYYKASMLGWYQKYEDYKRHHQAFNGDIRYKNKALHLPNLEDQLTFRNSGVGLDKNKKRNLVQLYSTEGAISSFFTHLSTSNLQNHYLDTAFYLPFLYDSNAAILQSPESFFTPLQNQFIKYFYVLHHYVVFNNSSKAQLIDFIDGYIKTFPSEESKVRKIFIKSLGREYSNELPPPLWLLVKNHQHRLLTFDPFDAITVPIYTFDLNAAEIEDLQTIKGMTRNAAQGIVDYRENNGYYSDLEQLKKVPGLSEELRREIISAKFENSYFEESLKDFEPKLSIGILVLSPLKYILSRAAIYYLFLFGVMYFALIRQNTSSAKQVILLFIKYFLLWVLFVIAGLVSVFIAEGNAYLYIILLFILSTLIALLVYRKRKKEMQRTLVFTGTMCLLLLTSVV